MNAWAALEEGLEHQYRHTLYFSLGPYVTLIIFDGGIDLFLYLLNVLLLNHPPGRSNFCRILELFGNFLKI